MFPRLKNSGKTNMIVEIVMGLFQLPSKFTLIPFMFTASGSNPPPLNANIKKHNGSGGQASVEKSASEAGGSSNRHVH